MADSESVLLEEKALSAQAPAHTKLFKDITGLFLLPGYSSHYYQTHLDPHLEHPALALFLGATDMAKTFVYAGIAVYLVTNYVL